MSTPKRIAVFLDGTWNTLGDNTNVWRLKSLCDPEDVNQLIFYSAGVGTQLGEKVRGSLFGYGLDREITDAYEWLIDHYNEGDQLFIFGFSRGAYTARSLSGFISKCGLLKPGSPVSHKQVYERYRRRQDKTIRELLLRAKDGVASPTTDLEIEERWLLRYSIPIDIDFIGVWDTVGSLGVPFLMRFNVAKYRFLETHLRFSNRRAYHAMAIDEHRASFAPTLWTRTTKTDANPAAPRALEDVEQRWFVGAHANVGGGYPSDLLAQIPLKWLMSKAAALGLKFRSDVELDQASVVPPVADSYSSFMGGAYRFCSRRYFRTIGAKPIVGPEDMTETINETIDGTAFHRWRVDPSYRPRNLADWAKRARADPALITQSVLASDSKSAAPH
ncbi:DUF2235 domain-containing protein [Mesorhizobium sp.]|uniref:DUF2235 domain-containing protein n=1 Tax=Mesorhizobium sp. TaxID=1871066 RepID=UPI000FE5ACDF|nr:DUF2235 domain-containing protein [Mesorhizobium sp.]RWF67349.1 MAG: DUF2235 domain-containing protein [Mesorhizobium sp.]TIT44551.1 MAG: DUF2235 domain-containing protein [Mesorhizobium sp.]